VVLVPPDADYRALVSELIFRLPGVLELISAVIEPDKTVVSGKSTPARLHQEESSADKNRSTCQHSYDNAFRE
jgi:hypothetical protein